NLPVQPDAERLARHQRPGDEILVSRRVPLDAQPEAGAENLMLPAAADLEERAAGAVAGSLVGQRDEAEELRGARQGEEALSRGLVLRDAGRREQRVDVLAARIAAERGDASGVRLQFEGLQPGVGRR